MYVASAPANTIYVLLMNALRYIFQRQNEFEFKRFTLKSITCLFLILKLSTWFLLALKLSVGLFFFFFILVALKLSTLTHGNELRNN
jgi:hypothetical protein